MISHMMPLIAAMTFAMALAPAAHAADNGLITKESRHSVAETVAKFEAAIKAKAAGGWSVFTTIDHAAAAQKAGLTMKPRTVIVFGNPTTGTPPMIRSAMLAIDLPMKALVWQDDADKVWLTYNSSDYLNATIFARHGVAMPGDAAKMLDAFLASVSDASVN
jgi:uncharacterized protein (DUF302 family)